MKCFLCFLMHTFLRISHVLELCAKLSPTDEEKHNEDIILCQCWNPSMTSALRVLRNFSICIYITLIIKITCDHWYFHCNVGFYCDNGPSYDSRNAVRLKGVMRRFRSHDKSPHCSANTNSHLWLRWGGRGASKLASTSKLQSLEAKL